MLREDPMGCRRSNQEVLCARQVPQVAALPLRPLKMSIFFVLLRKYRFRSCELGKKIQTANSIRDVYDPPFGGSSDLKEPVWEP